jgi:hypothetical protein
MDVFVRQVRRAVRGKACDEPALLAALLPAQAARVVRMLGRLRYISTCFAVGNLRVSDLSFRVCMTLYATGKDLREPDLDRGLCLPRDMGQLKCKYCPVGLLLCAEYLLAEANILLGVATARDMEFACSFPDDDKRWREFDAKMVERGHTLAPSFLPAAAPSRDLLICTVERACCTCGIRSQTIEVEHHALAPCCFALELFGHSLRGRLQLCLSGGVESPKFLRGFLLATIVYELVAVDSGHGHLQQRLEPFKFWRHPAIAACLQIVIVRAFCPHCDPLAYAMNRWCLALVLWLGWDRPRKGLDVLAQVMQALDSGHERQKKARAWMRHRRPQWQKLRQQRALAKECTAYFQHILRERGLFLLLFRYWPLCVQTLSVHSALQ